MSPISNPRSSCDALTGTSGGELAARLASSRRRRLSSRTRGRRLLLLSLMCLYLLAAAADDDDDDDANNQQQHLQLQHQANNSNAQFKSQQEFHKHLEESEKVSSIIRSATVTRRRRGFNSRFVMFAEAIPDANRLYEDLMMTYNKIVRPVQNNSERVVVKLSLKLSQLIDVNLKNQMMTTNVWLNQEWSDYKLKWDPSEYGGIEDINVPAEQIWLPDIVLYNSAEGYFAVSIMTKAKVHYDGHVTWNPPAIFRSSCQIDITYFPFDSQNCHLKFGSWTFGAKIDLRHMLINNTEQSIERGTDLSEYYQNVEWDIMKASARRNVITYNCCPDDFYPDVTFNFTLRRKPLFYTVNLILPCVGITILSFLVFYLPSDSGEKVTLTISILVSLIFFLSVLIETIPSTSLAMPLLGKYLVFTMILITVSVCATVFVLNIHFRTPSTHSMPGWVKRWCIDVLPKFLFMNVPQYQSSSTVLPEQLIYSHNSAYAAQSRQQPANNGDPLAQLDPAMLLARQQQQQQQQWQQTYPNATANAQQQQQQQTNLQPSSMPTNKQRGQLKQLNVNSLDSQLMQQANKLGTSPSSLFLPYLQSEAARRLQLQRSRSSERDTRSNMSDLQANQCDTSGIQMSLANDKRQTSIEMRQAPTGQKQQLGGARVTSGKRRRPSQDNSNNKDNQAGQSPSIWRLFSSSSAGKTSRATQAKANQAHQNCDNDNRRQQQRNLRRQQLDNEGSNDENNNDEDDKDDEDDNDDQYDYQHHNHFKARASICSTNLWRIGPTRRCSVAVPANYPTYYRPIVAAVSPNLAGLNPTQLSTISGGCINSSHHHHHHHHHSQRDDSDESSSVHEGVAIGALVRSAAANLAVRPREQTQGAGQYLQPPTVMFGGQQMKPLYAVQPELAQQRNLGSQQLESPQPLAPPPPLPPTSISGVTSRLNGGAQYQPIRQQNTLQMLQPNAMVHQQSQIANQYLRQQQLLHLHQPQLVNSRGTRLNLSAVGSNFEQNQSHFRCQQPIQIPRSRSTGQQLCSYAIGNQPQYLVSAANQQAHNQGASWQQQQQQQQQPKPGNYYLQSSQSIGRALGQAYMQRLQRQPAVFSMQTNNMAGQPQIRTSRSMQRGAYLIPLQAVNSQPASQQSFEFNQPQQQLYHDSNIRRCRSQTSLDRRAKLASNLQCCADNSIESANNHYSHQACNLTGSMRRRPQDLQQQPAAQIQGKHCCGQRDGSSRYAKTKKSLSRQPPPLTQLGYLKLINQVDKAIQNAMFIAQHIDNLDEFESVKENWKYIAMVIDRIFLIVFLFACIVGTVTIFAMVPWSYYTHEKPIDLQLTRLVALNLTTTSGANQTAFSRSCHEY